MRITDKIKEGIIATPIIAVFSLCFIGIFTGSFWALGKGIDKVYENKTEKKLSQQVGENVGDIKNIKVINQEEGCKILVECIQKKTENKLVFEYILTETEYIAMQNEDMTNNEYFYRYIAPYRKPSFCGNEKEYNAYLTQCKEEDIKHEKE